MKVSVIIPCYNVEEYIRECLRSVAVQTYRNIEVICVNDGSSDRTLSVIEEIRESFPFKLHVIDNGNHGASYARNRGLSVAQGEYIQFLDADDIILPEKLANQVNLIEGNNEGISVIVGNYIRRHYNGFETLVQADTRGVWYGLIKTRLGTTSSNLWIRKNLLDVGGFNEKLESSQEYELMFRLLRKNPTVLYDSVPLTIKRVRQTGSIGNNKPIENNIRYIDLRLSIRNYLNINGILDAELDKSINQSIFNTIQSLYSNDQKQAKAMYRDHIPVSFIPDIPSNKRFYFFLYRIFGFNTAEMVWSFYKFCKNILRKYIKK